MQLLVIQNGRSSQVLVAPLRAGAIGNGQTMRYILPMIREDAAFDLELRRRTEQLIADCPPRDFDCQVGKVFELARSIHYDNDPIDVERIADAQTTLNEDWGDCGDKAILMASMLGAIGYLSRLVKVNFRNDLKEHGYDHLYLEVQRPGGEWEPFDPTPENAPPGWEASAPVRDVEEIWPAVGFGPKGVAGLFDDLLQQGINTGFNLGAKLLGPSPGGGQAAQADAVGRQYDQMAHQLQQFLVPFSSQPVLTADQINSALAGYQQVATFAQQYGGISYVANQWASDGAGFRTWIEALAAKVSAGQVPVSNQQSAVSQPSSGVNSLSSVLKSPFIWIALAGAVILWLRQN